MIFRPHDSAVAGFGGATVMVSAMLSTLNCYEHSVSLMATADRI